MYFDVSHSVKDLNSRLTTADFTLRHVWTRTLRWGGTSTERHSTKSGLSRARNQSDQSELGVRLESPPPSLPLKSPPHPPQCFGHDLVFGAPAHELTVGLLPRVKFGFYIYDRLLGDSGLSRFNPTITEKKCSLSFGVIPRHDLSGPPLQLNGIASRLCLSLVFWHRPSPPLLLQSPDLRICELLVPLISSLMVWCEIRLSDRQKSDDAKSPAACASVGKSSQLVLFSDLSNDRRRFVQNQWRALLISTVLEMNVSFTD